MVEESSVRELHPVTFLEAHVASKTTKDFRPRHPSADPEPAEAEAEVVEALEEQAEEAAELTLVADDQTSDTKTGDKSAPKGKAPAKD